MGLLIEGSCAYRGAQIWRLIERLITIWSALPDCFSAWQELASSAATAAAADSEAWVGVPPLSIRLGPIEKRRVQHQELPVRAAPSHASDLGPRSRSPRGPDQSKVSAAGLPTKPDPAADPPFSLASSSRSRLQADPELVSGVFVVVDVPDVVVDVAAAASTVPVAGVHRRQTLLRQPVSDLKPSRTSCHCSSRLTFKNHGSR